LARDIEGDRIGSVHPDDVGKAIGCMIKRLIPARSDSRLVAMVVTRVSIRSDLWMERPKRLKFVTGSQMEDRAFGAQFAQIGRMVGISAHADNPGPIGLDQNATADAAVTAGRFDFVGRTDRDLRGICGHHRPFQG